MLNSSAMDIMYYTSPLYRDEVSITVIFTCSCISNSVLIIFKLAIDLQ